MAARVRDTCVNLTNALTYIDQTAIRHGDAINFGVTAQDAGHTCITSQR